MIVRPTRASTGTEVVDGCAIWCPGCDDVHAVSLGPNGWTYDGNAEAPTFSPSILVQGVHRLGTPLEGTPWVCHSFIRNGVWDFLPDSTHRLSGNSAPVMPFPDGFSG